jgi:diguanylate cyclase (GGDEF)-like protein
VHTHRWFPFIVLGLLSVLIGLFFFIFDFQQLTRTNTQNAREAFNTSNLYQQASFLVVAQELYEQKYLQNPTPVNYSTFQSAITTFEDNLQYIMQQSTQTDRAALQQIIATQQQYQDEVQQIVTAIQANQTELAAQIDAEQVSPLYLTLQSMVDAASTKEYSLALSHMDDAVAFEDRSSSLLPLVCGIGFVLLLALAGFLYRSQRSLARAQQREIEHFKQSSLTDNLTQLGNHRAYQEAYQREIAHAQRSEKALSLALIDVDEFKQYNDQHGHAYGDHILKTLAQVLLSSRAEDQAFRLGGDEFAMILRHTTIDEASHVLERLREAVQQRLTGVTISIGIAMLQKDASNAAVLQEQSDAALYEAKGRGRNCLVTFPEIENKAEIPHAA